MQYNKAFIFSKHADLLPYFYGKYDSANITSTQYTRLKSEYAVKRDVQLILLVRYEDNKTICRIKCPISPMPINGEFNVINMRSIMNFLHESGWQYEDTWNLNMFR